MHNNDNPEITSLKKRFKIDIKRELSRCPLIIGFNVLCVCDSKPCKNGGSCLLTKRKPGYKCNCTSAFMGPFCTKGKYFDTNTL